MFIAYAILDGYDLGVGTLHLWIARSNEERRITLNAIGPVWNGNEVWLVAGGGMLVVAFPRVYASGFSGFYLALMVVLWLLVLRGVSIEFRDQVDDPLWRGLWDTGFCLGSALLSLLLGVALGNVVRGLPLEANGYFQGTFALVLNPYSLLTGVLSLVVLAWHGANFLRTKTEGSLHRRVQVWSRRLGRVAALLAGMATAATFVVRPDNLSSFRSTPLFWVFPVLAAAAFTYGLLAGREGWDRAAFWSSTLTIAGLLGSAAASVFPNLLTSTLNPAYSLTVYNAASSPLALRAAFIANVLGMIAVGVYSTYVHRIFHGKVQVRDHGY
jgi:cytochrome d ubiquinol oxidase subunit II